MIARSPLRDLAYQQIVDRVQLGQLPAGSRVRDIELAAQLGVSRTPVREALLRLAREGVLETSMGRGFTVRRLDPAEIREVGAILGALEALALRLSPPASPARLDRLREIDRRLDRTRGDVSACLDLEDEWHRVLLEECPNRRLIDLITALRQVPRRYLAAYLRDAGTISLSTQPHAKILHALSSGTGDSVAAVFDQQWRRAVAELDAWASRAAAGSSS